MDNSTFRLWDELLTEDDKIVVAASGLGQPVPLGRRPCLLIIDVQNLYAVVDKPITEVLSKWPFGCGRSAYLAVRQIREVLSFSRESRIPVVYTRQLHRDTLTFSTIGSKSSKAGAQNLEGSYGVQIVDMIKPQSGDIVLDKSYASPFYGTPILSYLNKLDIDTLLITGGTTSGCVRATAIDAVVRNFAVAVIADCVYDRIDISHKVTLFDLWFKYATVIDSMNAISYVKGLSF